KNIVTPTLHVFRRLRRQPLDEPAAVSLARVPKSVVQPIRASLPKFECVRCQPVAAPVRRQWDPFVLEALGHFCHARIEHTPSVDDFALPRNPGAQLASQRTRMEISLRLFPRGFFYFSADPNLSVELDPVKTKRGVRIGIELFPLGAFVIAEEDEALLIKTFQQNDSH